MRAKGSLLLRSAAPCLIGATLGIFAHGQFLVPPDTNLVGGEFVRTFDVRAGGIPIENDNLPNTSAKIEGYENLLLFSDGRQLRGRLASAGKDGLIWSRPDFSEPLHLRCAEVDCVYLAPKGVNDSFYPEIDPPAAAVPATVKLGGDDWLRGVVTSPDGHRLIIQNQWSSITIQRSQAEWLFFDWDQALGGGFDGGILDARDWLKMAPSAKLQDHGVLEIFGEKEWFGRLLLQPPRFEISMEIPADSEQGSRLWLEPRGPAPGQFTTGSVEIKLDPKQLSLRRFTNTMESKTMPVSEDGGADANGMVRYHLFYDSEKLRLIIFRNGRKLGEWKSDANSGLKLAPRGLPPPAVAPIPGLEPIPGALFPGINGISLVQGSTNSDEGEPPDGRRRPLKLRRFHVGPWDGNLPPEDDASTTQDRLSSADLRSFAGELEGITNKDVIFSKQRRAKTPGMLIRLPGVPGAPPDTVARIYLDAAGEISVSSLEIRDNTAHLHTAFEDDLKLPAAALSVIGFSSSGPRSTGQGDSLLFKNGDELPGSLISATPGAPLRWRMPGGQEVAIELKNLAGIRHETPALSKAAGESACVELRNGDRLRGGVVSFNERGLEFNATLLGPLSVERSRIWKIFPQTGAEIRGGADDPSGWMDAKLPEGPEDLDPNQSNSDPKLAWLYFDGRYITKPKPARENGPVLPLLSSRVPPQKSGPFEFRADITSTGGTMPMTSVSITSVRNEEGRFSAISVQFTQGNMLITTVNSQGVRNRQVDLGGKIGISTPLSLRVFVNPILGTADILLNGILAARIGQEPAERAPDINYAAHIGGISTDGQPIIFSNLWIGPWDGELPGTESRASTALANGDATANVPSAMKDGKYILETEIGSLRLPAASVSAIAFGGECAPAHAAARLRLVDGSVVHVSHFECHDRTISAGSETLGVIHLPLEFIAEIIFDPPPIREPLGPQLKKPAQSASSTAAAPPATPQETQ